MEHDKGAVGLSRNIINLISVFCSHTCKYTLKTRFVMELKSLIGGPTDHTLTLGHRNMIPQSLMPFNLDRIFYPSLKLVSATILRDQLHKV